MSAAKTALKVVGGIAGVAALAIGGTYVWASTASSAKLAQTYETHAVDFPVPFPLSEVEIEALRAERAAAAAATGDVEGDAPADPLAGVDLDTIALDRAVARGKHLVTSRFVCIECHGENFGGGVMIDDPAIGRLLGPNITAGKGGKTAKYTVADWDRMVRHGVKPDGKPGGMPSEDFFEMSDRELSDVIAYVRSMPPVDAEVPPVQLGPVGKILVATGKLELSADKRGDHHAAHAVEPPEAAPTAEFGKHVAQVCTGCHRADFSGGPVSGGDPSWPPSANLTTHADGLAGWTYEDFKGVMLEGRSKDGTMLREPMSLMPKYAKNMTEDELRALWAFIESLPPKPTGT